MKILNIIQNIALVGILILLFLIYRGMNKTGVYVSEMSGVLTGAEVEFSLTD